MITILNEVHANWTNVKNKCRTTVNKEYTDNEPNSEFKRRLLISEHSPIRLLTVDWSWKKIKSWVATHWSRHKFEKYISTRRSDRTGVDRNGLPQGIDVNFDGCANAQSLIDAMRKRLCYQASPETRTLAVDLKNALKEVEPELADVLVPNCIYRSGCPEFQQCGFWKNFSSTYTKEYLIDIEKRYTLYNEQFYKTNS